MQIKHRRPLVIILTIFSLFIFNSCKDKKDSTTNPCAVQCQNGGYCLEDKCQCPNGYEGLNCERRSLARYIGKWEMHEVIVGSSDKAVKGHEQTYTCSIKEMPDNVLNFLIDDFAGNKDYDNVRCQLGVTDKGGQDLPTNFIFPYMQVIPGSKVTIEKGYGSVNELGTTMTGTYYTNYILDSALAIDTVYFSATIIL